jgi:uncharacterized protein YciI
MDGIPDSLEVEDLFAIEAEFAADAHDRRPRFRREHLERYARLVREGRILFGGALGDVESAFIVIRATDEAEAREVAERDIYWTSGTWASFRVRRYQLIRVREGAPQT